MLAYQGLKGQFNNAPETRAGTNYCKDTEPLYNSFMYSFASLLSGIYPFLAMHSLLVTIICYAINYSEQKQYP